MDEQFVRDILNEVHEFVTNDRLRKQEADRRAEKIIDAIRAQTVEARANADRIVRAINKLGSTASTSG